MFSSNNTTRINPSPQNFGVEWPLLLKVDYHDSAKKPQSVWGTGFLVQVEDVSPTPTLPIETTRMPQEEAKARVTAMQEEREKMDQEMKMKFERPDHYQALMEYQAQQSQTQHHSEEQARQQQGNWSVGHQNQGNKVWLVTNEHILKPKNCFSYQITLFFRPRHGGTTHNQVTLQLTPQPQQWFTTVLSHVTDPDNKPLDVAVLPLTMMTGTLLRCYQWNSAPNVLIRIPRCPGGPVKVPEEVFCAGFPHLQGDEHGVWEYREPAVLRGNVVVTYPHLKQFRVAMLLMWGMSGSLVFRYTNENGIEPLGVFSHIKFASTSSYDSSIRVVWDWSLVESLVGVRDNSKRVIIVYA